MVHAKANRGKTMDNSTRDPVAQASEFFIEFRVGATPAVRAQFEKWIRASPEHVEAYLEVAAGWSELPIADPEGRIDLQSLVAAARNCGDENVIQLRLPQATPKPPVTQHRVRTWTLAATLALPLILAGASILTIMQRGRTYSTGIGEQRTLILADGSTVILNALATISVRMTKEAREVTLVRGQAYFHDTDEPSRPFIVLTGTSEVRAIGTEFAIDKEPHRTVVTVLNGEVAVANSFARIDSLARRDLLQDLSGPSNRVKAVFVSAGEQITVQARNIPAPKPVDVVAATAWMQQRLIFDDTPLAAVAQQFNMYSKRRLVIADPPLRSLGISGIYSVSDPAALIGFLRSQPTLQVTETDDAFVVSRR